MTIKGDKISLILTVLRLYNTMQQKVCQRVQLSIHSIGRRDGYEGPKFELYINKYLYCYSLQQYWFEFKN